MEQLQTLNENTFLSLGIETIHRNETAAKITEMVNINLLSLNVELRKN